MASVENILRNIYGVSATGSLQNMTGGNIKSFPHLCLSSNGFMLKDNEGYTNEIRPKANIKYIDENVNMIGGACGGSRKASKPKKSKKQGRKMRGSAADIVFASAEYIKNNDLKDFIEKFYLYYRFSRSQNSSIYIVPPRSVLDKMIDLRGKGTEGSAELQEQTRANKDKIGYERYLFVTFGNNTTKDKYRIVDDKTSSAPYPATSFGTLRRTNLIGEVFYITCDDKLKVKIHTKPTNADQGKELKFIGRFTNGGYVFQGEIPEKSLEVIPPKKANARAFSHLCSKMSNDDFTNMNFGEFTIMGGFNNQSLELLNMYTDFYNQDHELAAEHFLKAADKKNKLKSKYVQNGDLLYNSLYFALSEPNAMNINDFGNESKTIMKNFKPSMKDSNFKNAVINIQSKFNKIHKQCAMQNNYNKFMKAYKNIYTSKDVAKMKADILTTYIRNNNSSNIIDSAKLINDIFESDNINASESNIIKNAFESGPLPSAFGTEFSPLFNNEDITFEKIIKNKSSGEKRTSQYDEDEENDTENYTEQIYNSKKKNTKRKQRQQEEPTGEDTNITQSDNEEGMQQTYEEADEIEQEESTDKTLIDVPENDAEEAGDNQAFSIVDLY